MIHTEHLTKQFQLRKGQPPITAVEDLSLHVNQGEVFGFLGPNGAGKTTTVRLLTSLIGPTAGTASVNGLQLGKDDQAIRRCVGILTETPGMYDRLSAQKNLTIFANLYGMRKPAVQVEKYLRMLGLWERRSDEVGSFSKGMRQKLAIARSILHEPQVLFLDEPTSGLDPEAALLVRDFIEELKAEGRTIFLCTHNLDEADRLCARIAVFKTRLIRVDSPENLRMQLFGRTVVFHLRAIRPEWESMLSGLPYVKSVKTVDSKLVIDLEKPEQYNPEIVRCLVEQGADIQFVGELRHSLEDVYLNLIHSSNEEK